MYIIVQPLTNDDDGLIIVIVTAITITIIIIIIIINVIVIVIVIFIFAFFVFVTSTSSHHHNINKKYNFHTNNNNNILLSSTLLSGQNDAYVTYGVEGTHSSKTVENSCDFCYNYRMLRRY